jgi:transcriptional antiterminator RfaH
MTNGQKMKVQNEKKWYAVYTHFNNEKKVATQLGAKGIEIYLPLRKILRQWSDRKKWVEEPLIRSYVFVNITSDEADVLRFTPGIATMVSFGGRLVPITQKEIDLLQLICGQQPEVVDTPIDLLMGDAVEVIAGPLLGLKAELTAWKGKQQVVVRIDALNRYLLVDIPAYCLRKTIKQPIVA